MRAPRAETVELEAPEIKAVEGKADPRNLLWLESLPRMVCGMA